MSEIQSEPALVAEIDLGDVLDFTSGQFVHLEVSIPLLLPRAEFQQPNLALFFQSDLSWLTGWILDAGFAEDAKAAEMLLTKFKDTVSYCLFIMPTTTSTRGVAVEGDDDAVDVPDKLKIYILFMFESLMLDDLIETKNIFGAGADGARKCRALATIILDVMRGKYKDMSALPRPDAPLRPFVKGGFLFAEFANRVVPGFRNDCLGFVEAAKQGMEAAQILQSEAAAEPANNSDWPNGSGSCPEEGIKNLAITPSTSKVAAWRINEQTFTFMRAHDGGAAYFIELAALLNGVTLPASLRGNLYFKRLMELAASIGAHFNDVIGIRRDVFSAQESLNFSCIFYRMRKYGQSLPDSFEQSAHIVWENVEEFKIIARRLRSGNPTNSRLHQFIRVVERFLDGTVYWATQTERRYDVKATVFKERQLN